MSDSPTQKAPAPSGAFFCRHRRKKTLSLLESGLFCATASRRLSGQWLGANYFIFYTFSAFGV